MQKLPTAQYLPLPCHITPNTHSQHHHLLFLLRPAHRTTDKLKAISISSISVAMQLLLWPQRRTSCVRAYPESLQATQSHYIETGHDSFLSSFQTLRRRLPVLNNGSKVTTAAHKQRVSKHAVHINLIVAPCIFTESLQFINQRMHIQFHIKHF